MLLNRSYKEVRYFKPDFKELMITGVIILLLTVPFLVGNTSNPTEVNEKSKQKSELNAAGVDSIPVLLSGK